MEMREEFEAWASSCCYRCGGGGLNLKRAGEDYRYATTHRAFAAWKAAYRAAAFKVALRVKAEATKACAIRRNIEGEKWARFTADKCVENVCSIDVNKVVEEAAR